MDGFQKRHPDLTCRLPEQMKASRQKSSVNKDIYDSWFKLLWEILEENDLWDKPKRMYNVDESKFPLDPRRLNPMWDKTCSGSSEGPTVSSCSFPVLYAAK